MDAESRPSSPPENSSCSEPSGSNTPTASPRRLFLHEPGWGVALKIGSERAFCYQIAPGQDYYHRLLDGEIYLYHGDEKLCLACAARRGLLSHDSRSLRNACCPLPVAGEPQPGVSEFEIVMPDDPPQSGEGKPAR
jgi:hypothetical protein